MHQPAKSEISVPYLEQSLLRPALPGRQPASNDRLVGVAKCKLFPQNFIGQRAVHKLIRLAPRRIGG
jgi:hypothetical protein